MGTSEDLLREVSDAAPAAVVSGLAALLVPGATDPYLVVTQQVLSDDGLYTPTEVLVARPDGLLFWGCYLLPPRPKGAGSGHPAGWHTQARTVPAGQIQQVRLLASIDDEHLDEPAALPESVTLTVITSLHQSDTTLPIQCTDPECQKVHGWHTQAGRDELSFVISRADRGDDLTRRTLDMGAVLSRLYAK